jgi:hypothetical protein
MSIAMPLYSSGRLFLEAQLVSSILSAGAGNESGPPPPGMKGGSETSGDVLRLRLHDPSNGNLVFASFDSSFAHYAPSLYPS